MVRHALERFKKNQGIARTRDIFVIVAVFSLAGASIALTVRPLYNYIFHLIPHVPLFFKVFVYVFVAIPTYQGFLLIYGFLFGQFKFFWEREKKLGRWILKTCGSSKETLLSLKQKQESKYV